MLKSGDVGPAASIILNRLRAETADQHNSVERVLNVLRPDFDSAAYVHLLQGFYGIFAAWEPAAERVLEAELPDFAQFRRKLPLLEQDLATLAICSGDLPVCDALTRPPSPAHALGAAYVFEGSTLGGQILSRHFRERLGVTPAFGGAFFAGYGDRTAAMWREFRARLEAFAARTGSEDEIVMGARGTFAEVERWLSRPLRG